MLLPQVVSKRNTRFIINWNPVLHSHRDTIKPVYSYNPNLLVVISPTGIIDVWDTVIGKHLCTFEGNYFGTAWSIASFAFLPNSNRIGSVSYDSNRTVRVWDATTGKRLRTIEHNNNHLISFPVISYDLSRVVATINDCTLKVWESATGACLQTLDGHNGTVYPKTFSYDSALVASGSFDKTVKVWDIATGTCLQTFTGHSDSIRCVAFSYDASLVASGSFDNTVKVWDVLRGTCVVTVDRKVEALTFDLTNRYLHTDLGGYKLEVQSSTLPLATSSLPGSVHRSRSPEPFPSSESTKPLSMPATTSQPTQPIYRINPYGIGIGQDREWITWGSHNIIWLPHGCLQVWRSTVILGAHRDQTSFLTLSTEYFENLFSTKNSNRT